MRLLVDENGRSVFTNYEGPLGKRRLAEWKPGESFEAAVKRAAEGKADDEEKVSESVLSEELSVPGVPDVRGSAKSLRAGVPTRSKR